MLSVFHFLITVGMKNKRGWTQVTRWVELTCYFGQPCLSLTQSLTWYGLNMPQPQHWGKVNKEIKSKICSFSLIL